MRPTLPVALLALGVGCRAPVQEVHWWDGMRPSSPCYEVDLLDGLDEGSTAEVRALFQCLDQGQLSSLRHGVDQLEVDTRSGDPAGVEVARAVNALPEAGTDPWALAGVAVDALTAEDRPLDAVLDLFLEWSYGVPATQVRSGEVALTSSSHLAGGVLAPLAPVLTGAAEAVLDDELRIAAWAGELALDPETRRWILTASAWAASTRPEVAGPVDGLLSHLGEALLATRSPSNDLWTGASGDSLRDLVQVSMLGVVPVLPRIAPEAAEILGDPLVRQAFEDDVVRWEASGRLGGAVEQMAWLASVDVDGQARERGELSGLYRLLRLLHDTNRPMRCTLDLWIAELEVDLGNLAVSLLRTMAHSDPDTVQSGVGILGEVVGWGLSEWILVEIAESGTCPTLTTQVVSDLPAIDLFYRDESYDLLVVALDLLQAMEGGREDRIPALVNLASDAYTFDAVPPTEEFFRDVADTALVDDLAALVPVLASPASHGIRAGNDPAADLQDLGDLMLWVVEEGEEGTGFSQLEPLVRAVAHPDETWTALGAQATLLADRSSRSSRALDALPPLLALDPDLVVLDSLGPVLADARVAAPVLRVVESEAVVGAFLATEPQASDPEVPLAFASRLIIGGALDDLLAMVDVVVSALAELTADS